MDISNETSKTVEEKISKLVHRTLEIIQIETQRENKAGKLNRASTDDL